MADDTLDQGDVPAETQRSARLGLSPTSSSASEQSVGSNSNGDLSRTQDGRVVAKAGHEGFVQPSSYLRPQAHSNPVMPAEPERAIDRDERLGLVSSSYFFA